MPYCNHCGENVSQVFQCSNCGQNYCSFHKNPIDHECNIIAESIRIQQPAQYTPTYNETIQSGTDVRGTTDGSYTWYRQESAIPENAFAPDSGIDFKGIFLAHKSELTHFLIAGIIIFIIGIISFFDIISSGYIWALFILSSFYLTSFLFHELGHRQVALHFGLQTKFRLLTYGMLMTLISLGRFALPGAVVVLGLEKISRKTGLCKAAGPFVNLCYGLILLLASFLIPTGLYPLNFVFCIGAYLNFMLGAFNMIPFGILDGQNIWKWNKKVYISLIIPLIGLLIFTLILQYTQLGITFYFP